MMIGKLIRLGRRKLHTIISREIIKPSSPTPSHLHTYNLSELDQIAPHSYQPLILFYPNNKSCILSADQKSRKLKKSLSRSLTRYYPLAGRLNTPTTPYIGGNDEGVVFVEAKNDSSLDKFQNVNDNDEAVSQLFADGMVWQNPSHNKSLIGVQINHFECGGIGVAVSMSHKVGDGCTLGSFMSHWASVALYGSTDHQEVLALNPHFIQSPATNSVPAETSVLNQSCDKLVSKSFVFLNSKLTDLKDKILAGSTLPINNPTRVEALTSLLYKTAVAAATSNSQSFFKPSYLFIPMDIRKKFVPMLPQTTVGNFVSAMIVTTRHSSETSLSIVVSELQKAKKEVEPVKSVKQVLQNFQSFLSKLGNEDYENVAKRSFWCSSLCGFPFNKVDFGWGKPTGATIILRPAHKTCFVLMDTPNGDGIEARVVLEKQDMEMFQNDKELLSFCQSS